MNEVSTFTPSHRGGSGPPLVCLHGFLDTWRSWELVLPRLEAHHDVFVPTLPGHAGGPALNGEVTVGAVLDALERQLDSAGLDEVALVGNSLGGYLALKLAERGRATSVVAFAPAGGWSSRGRPDIRGGDGGQRPEAGGCPDAGERPDAGVLDHQLELHARLVAIGPRAAELVNRPNGRRAASAFITRRFEHIPAELLAHQLLGVAGADGAPALVDAVRREGWFVDATNITCPVRMVWGSADKLLPWPAAALGYREDLPHADWVVLDDVGHCPQLDVPLEAAELIIGF